MKKNSLAKSLFCLFLVIAGTVSAYPCRCTPGSLSLYYRRADAVVTATVVSVSIDSGQNTTARLEVLDSWKRDLTKQIEVITGSSCAYDFDVGEKHLLYLRAAPSGKFSTMKCQGNVAFDDSQKSRKWLNRYGKKGTVDLSLMYLPTSFEDFVAGPLFGTSVECSIGDTD